MVLRNPTHNKVSILIKGDPYEISAGSEIVVPDEVGNAWCKIHEFLQIGSTTPTPVEKPEIAQHVNEETTIVKDKPTRGRPSKK